MRIPRLPFPPFLFRLHQVPLLHLALRRHYSYMCVQVQVQVQVGTGKVHTYVKYCIFARSNIRTRLVDMTLAYTTHCIAPIICILRMYRKGTGEDSAYVRIVIIIIRSREKRRLTRAELVSRLLSR